MKTHILITESGIRGTTVEPPESLSPVREPRSLFPLLWDQYDKSLTAWKDSTHLFEDQEYMKMIVGDWLWKYGNAKESFRNPKPGTILTVDLPQWEEVRQHYYEKWTDTLDVAIPGNWETRTVLRFTEPTKEVSEQKESQEDYHDTQAWADLKWTIGQIMWNKIHLSESGAIECNPSTHAIAEWVWANFTRKGEDHRRPTEEEIEKKVDEILQRIGDMKSYTKDLIEMAHWALNYKKE